MRASRIYAVTHKAKHGYPPDTWDFYKISFLLVREDRASPMAGAETHAMGFFGPDGIPDLSETRVISKDIEAAKDQAAIFD